MNNRRFFNLAASGYEFLTAQEVWRAQIAEALGKVEVATSARRVLDVGCGPGTSAFVLAEALPSSEVVGIDIAEEMIRRARRRHLRGGAKYRNVSFLECDLYEMPAGLTGFDLALGHSLVYLLPDRARALRAVAERMNPGGELVLLEPARGTGVQEVMGALRSRRGELRRRPGSWSRFAMSMITWRMMSGTREPPGPEELGELFEEAGFEEVRVEPTLGGLGVHVVGRSGGRASP